MVLRLSQPAGDGNCVIPRDDCGRALVRLRKAEVTNSEVLLRLAHSPSTVPPPPQAPHSTAKM